MTQAEKDDNFDRDKLWDNLDKFKKLEKLKLLRDELTNHYIHLTDNFDPNDSTLNISVTIKEVSHIVEIENSINHTKKTESPRHFIKLHSDFFKIDEFIPEYLKNIKEAIHEVEKLFCKAFEDWDEKNNKTEKL